MSDHPKDVLRQAIARAIANGAEPIIEQPTRELAIERSGKAAGTAAGSWVLDGNSSAEDARAILRAIENCELETPNPLSGEWADGWTAERVYEDAGLDRPNADRVRELQERNARISMFGRVSEEQQKELRDAYADRDAIEDEELSSWCDWFSMAYEHEAERLARFYSDESEDE